MVNKFKEYGFKRKAFIELNNTGVKGESHKGINYGYTRKFKVDNETITLNIIPFKNEWICEKETFNNTIYSEISNYTEALENDIELFKEFQKCNNMSRINFAMMKLNYTDKSYNQTHRWAYMESKEEALEEILFQYPWLFENY